MDDTAVEFRQAWVSAVPFPALYLMGMLASLWFIRRFRVASCCCLLGCVLYIATTIIMIYYNHHLRELWDQSARGEGDIREVEQRFKATKPLFTSAWLVCDGTILAAVFIGRRPRPATHDD